MSRLRSIVVVGAVFCLIILPTNTDAKKRSSRVIPQGPSLTLTRTNTSPDGAHITTLLTGRYQNGSKILNLRTLLSKTPALSYYGPPSILPPIGGANSASEPNGPDAESYQNDSEMSRSDGTVVVEAVYEYEQSTNQNMFSVTIAGVTLTFDLNTGEPGPVSDADLDTLNTWVVSEEGRLAQEAAVAIIQEEQQHPEAEELLIYCIVGMMLDTDPPVEAALRFVQKPRLGVRGHHARLTSQSASLSRINRFCWLSTPSTIVNSRLLKLLVPTMQGNCFGCCGQGCNCILNRNYGVIRGGPCETHDRCSRVPGQGPLSRPCLSSLGKAIVYTVYRFFF